MTLKDNASAGGALAEVETTGLNGETRHHTGKDHQDNNTPNDEGLLRIFYNNCNGLQPGQLLKAKLRQKIEKKKRDTWKRQHSIRK